MVEILSPKIAEAETVVGKVQISDVDTIQSTVDQILKDNKDLRELKYRHIIKLLVEDKLDKQLSDESVPRACRDCQNTRKMFEPEKGDNREQMEEEYNEFYAPQKKLEGLGRMR